MARFSFLLILLFTLNSSASVPQDSVKHTQSADPWLSVDKFHHFTASAVLTGLGYYAASREAGCQESAAIQAAAGFSLSLGIGKECYDKKKKGRLSYKDMIADILGIAVGVIIINATTE